MNGPVSGLVLAGGVSKRFGSDKRVAPARGRSLLERAVATMGAVVGGRLMVAVAAPGRLPTGGISRRADITWIHDDPADCGPLGAIVAALRRSRYGLLVSACDVPGVRAATLECLAELGAERDRPVVPRSARGWEPLVAYYPWWMCEYFAGALRCGVRAPHRLLDACGTVAAPWNAVEFRNVNRVEDLAAWEG